MGFINFVDYNFILGGASDSRHIGNYSAVLNDKGDTIQYNTPSECVSSSRKSDWSPDGKLFATGHAGSAFFFVCLVAFQIQTC
jgi:hypothetical protein